LPENDAWAAAHVQEAALDFIASFGRGGDPGRPLPELPFQASERRLFCISNAGFGAEPLIIIRRVFASALTLAVLAVLAGLAQLNPVGNAMAQGATAALLAKPGALPDMALGPAKAPVTIVEYASLTCPHCAAFAENVFPMLKSKYIDTNKVRFVFREFPLEIKAAAASMLARCIGNGDAGKYFGAIEQLFKQQDQLMDQTTATLKLIGAQQAGMSEQAVEACAKDQALLDKIKADQDFAFKQLKVDATPTFFINGEMTKGAMSFEELDKKIRSLLK
jgi:protein-disulfide isomerase